MESALETEFKWYLEHQEELVKKHNGKFIVIKNSKVLGSYDSVRAAVDETSKSQEMGTFIVQKCTPGDKDYTATFHSRVA